jgi:predicted metalloprotease
MQWQGRRGSANIEDRRGMGVTRIGGVGGIGAVALLLIGAYFGVDLSPLVGGGQVVTSGESRPLTEEDQRVGEFVSVTLADTEEVWAGLLAGEGQTYNPARLVLYKDVTQSACGNASGATGPFYCPNDQKIYLDTAFFTTLSQQLGASGDFAAAYVVAHEVAHHVQDELGILSQVNSVRQRSSETQSNALSVRIELQADCFSGVWARHAESQFGSIEAGDIAEAMNAAERIGDDTLQRNAGRRPMPDSFTHGTSAQREGWFQRGYESGDMNRCDTFSARSLG